MHRANNRLTTNLETLALAALVCSLAAWTGSALGDEATGSAAGLAGRLPQCGGPVPSHYADRRSTGQRRADRGPRSAGRPLESRRRQRRGLANLSESRRNQGGVQADGAERKSCGRSGTATGPTTTDWSWYGSSTCNAAWTTTSPFLPWRRTRRRSAPTFSPDWSGWLRPSSGTPPSRLPKTPRSLTKPSIGCKSRPRRRTWFMRSISTFVRPNVYGSISAEIVGAGFAEQIDETMPIQDCILGTAVSTVHIPWAKPTRRCGRRTRSASSTRSSVAWPQATAWAITTP